MELQNLKIIDFEKKGNVVRFYLGDKNLQEYYGDDWDDAPYDCNAGTVYENFMVGFIDVAFPFSSYVLEPSDEYNSYNCRFCKENMKNGDVPCIVYVPQDLNGSYLYDNFSHWAGSNRAYRFYFEDNINTNEKHEIFCNGQKIPGAILILIGTYPQEDENE